MNLTSPEAKLAAWHAEQTLESIGLTRERVLLMTAHIPRAPSAVALGLKRTRYKNEYPNRRRSEPRQPKPILDCDEPPVTLEQKHAAALKAVALFQSGVNVCRALQQSGFSDIYGVAVRQCAEGNGELFDAARSGEVPSGIRKNQIHFVRWFLNLAPISDEHDPDNERLRVELRRCGMKTAKIAAAAGINRNTVSAFVRGGLKRLDAWKRSKVWAVLKAND